MFLEILGKSMSRNFFMNFCSYIVWRKVPISGQILMKTQNKVNACKILKNAYILMKIYQIAHFHYPNVEN